ncbi:MAG: hypothetical protein J7M38_13140, partial [Armatimonadetes bacterium]|nr:hypothetical protein [Armatimonadota bacterium]
QILDSFSRAGGAVWGFAITSPTDGQLVGNKLTVTGTARPGAKVRVSINYWFHVIFQSWALLSQHEVTTDAAGVWRLENTDLNVSIFGKSSKYEVVAELLGDDGEVLATQRIQVRRN